MKDENFTEGVHFNFVKSSASIQLDDIKAMIFGGTSARFWLSRKHMISDVSMYKKRPPYYAWECLTLLLTDREVDLVIQKEADMNDLLAFLIESINTVDGNRNSAEKVYNILQE